MVPTAEDWIARLSLQRHPEGGWYRETYRSTDLLLPAGLPERFNAERSACTAIYYLLQEGEFSSLHRIRSDELWHFYAGGPLSVESIDANGKHRQFDIGPGQFQAVVPADSWFGAEPQAGSGYSLVGCTVAPGFDFADFELAERQLLLKQFPQHAELVTRLTRS